MSENCFLLGLKLGFIVLLTIGISSCWYPFFNLDVAIGEQLARKLGAPVLVMQGDIGGFGPEDLRDAFFVPRRNPATQLSGFLVTDNQFGRKILEIWFDVPQQRFDVFYSQSFPPGPRNNNLNQYLTDYGNLGIGLISHMNSDILGQYFTSLNPLNEFIPLPAPLVERRITSFTFRDGALNAQIDSIISIDWSSSNPNELLSKRVFFVDLNTFVGPTDLPLNFSEAFSNYGQPLSGYAGYSAIFEAFFISAKMENGAQRFFIWDGVLKAESPPSVLPIPQQVTGILSNGNYLAQEGSLIGVYSPAGSFLYSVNLGTVRFHFERFDDTNDTWYSVFSRVLQGEYELRVEVYEIKTSDFPSLAFQ